MRVGVAGADLDGHGGRRGFVEELVDEGTERGFVGGPAPFRQEICRCFGVGLPGCVEGREQIDVLKPILGGDFLDFLGRLGKCEVFGKTRLGDVYGFGEFFCVMPRGLERATARAIELASSRAVRSVRWVFSASWMRIRVASSASSRRRMAEIVVTIEDWEMARQRHSPKMMK